MVVKLRNSITMRSFLHWRHARVPATVVSLAVLLPGSVRVGSPHSVTPPALAFRQVTVVDVTTGEREPGQAGVVAGNRIRAVGPAGTAPVPRSSRRAVSI